MLTGLLYRDQYDDLMVRWEVRLVGPFDKKEDSRLIAQGSAKSWRKASDILASNMELFTERNRRGCL
jgi:hypothetical protein